MLFPVWGWKLIQTQGITQEGEELARNECRNSANGKELGLFRNLVAYLSYFDSSISSL